MSNDIYSILKRFDNLVEGQDAAQRSVHQLPALFKPKNISPVLGSKKDPANPLKGYFVGGESENIEASTTEDVVSTVKKKLGDYLQDVASAIKADPDLVDKIPQDADHIGPAVKTLTTDDGHEIKIHGNEDDGFRITIKNRPHSATFESLDHAVIACEMYCNRRRGSGSNNDYMEEKR